jgi:hypothetical protein
MTQEQGRPAEYPKEAQNPPTTPGARPDEQPDPKVRVPDPNPPAEKNFGDKREQTTQEEPGAGTPIERS